MPVAAANGIEITYTDTGGEGPAVVFSHGFLMDDTMFSRQVTALAPEYRVITWDQRGHGGRVRAQPAGRAAGRGQHRGPRERAVGSADLHHGDPRPGHRT